MYALLLLLHSWLRWPLLLLGVWLVVWSLSHVLRARPWGAGPMRTQQAFVGLLDLQLLVGLVLYFVLSPISEAAFQNFGLTMKDPTLRWFGVEHPATMLIAVAVAHIGKVRAAKATVNRARTVFRFQLAWLLLTLLSIPWPGMDVARPLFRM